MRPRRSPYAFALVACAALLALALVVAGPPAPAEAAATDAPVLRAPAGPDYTLEGIKWDRAVVDVYYTWSGGACVLDSQDFGSVASVTPPPLALAQLQAAITEINGRLRGALRLSLAGEVERATLCGKAQEYPIVVGWGALAGETEAGRAAMYYPRARAGQVASIQLSRVFVKNTLTFGCPGDDPQRDLRHILTHELLHAIGVGHSTVPDALMSPSSTQCRGSGVLQPDDIAVIAAIYPPPDGGTPTAPAPTSAAVTIAAFAAPPTFSAAGQALTMFMGGSVAQLEAAATTARAAGVWAQDTVGAYYLDVIGGPAFVNAAFRARFAAGFAGPTAVTLTR